MDFTLVEEEQMLADVVGRFVEKEYEFDARRRLAATPQGWSDAHWSTLAEMGVLALNVPQDHGGLGAGPVEILLVEDDPGDVLMTKEALADAKMANELHVVSNGEEALV